MRNSATRSLRRSARSLISSGSQGYVLRAYSAENTVLAYQPPSKSKAPSGWSKGSGEVARSYTPAMNLALRSPNAAPHAASAAHEAASASRPLSNERGTSATQATSGGTRPPIEAARTLSPWRRSTSRPRREPYDTPHTFIWS
jgi:hypothetical protein